MRTSTLASALTAVLIAFGAGTASAAEGKPENIVDLSYPLSEDFPWIEAPGTFPFSKEPIATIDEAGVAANKWTIHEHLGTQIDAPAHFAKGGRTMDQIRADELVVPIVVLAFKAEAQADVNAEVTVAKLEAWEGEHGRIPEGSVVVMNSGWGSRIKDAKRYLNRDASGTMRFPGFGKDAVIWLMEERDAWGVGVDTISFDPGYDKTYQAHRALEARDGWALEALANLDRLPPRGATMYVGAVNVRGATGGLVRPIAVWNASDVASAEPDIEGRWTSASPEPLPDGQGGFRYLTRNFLFEGDRWTIDFTIHGDEARTQLITAGRNEGSYEIEDGQTADGATFARFGFDERSLTPGSEGIAQALTNAGCGSEPWTAGQSQSVFPEGCEAFRVFSRDRCAGEFDVVKLDGDRLFLGARPADGYMCSVETRPQMAGDAALVRTQ